ncbi:unnamed protein product (mitochondrion) [Plasmodiophora brassicae]|uniref:Uncharacterized protein n=1 Tax=Plasmodiophora brassicae TaxID=37360 RepID=A0A0G4IU05_PLABS|nr:hypothetical protein PBRA_006723 [Plasmodiophora brassicae]SPR00740.1 unnamed protein product [Plasmodiophora brassicae]
MWAFHEDNFVLGAALVVIGMANVALVSLARIKRPQKLTLLPFAAIPFGFALQQICEASVWHGNLANQNAIRGFVFLAFPFWAAYVPCAMALMEVNRPRQRTESGIRSAYLSTTRKLVLSLFSVIGLLLFLYFTYALVINDPIHAELAGDHRIRYDITWPTVYGNDVSLMGTIIAGVYVGVVVGPFMVSSVGYTGLLGLCLFGALAAAIRIWEPSYASTASLFAALLSPSTFLITKREVAYRRACLQDKRRQPPPVPLDVL